MCVIDYGEVRSDQNFDAVPYAQLSHVTRPRHALVCMCLPGTEVRRKAYSAIRVAHKPATVLSGRTRRRRQRTPLPQLERVRRLRRLTHRGQLDRRADGAPSKARARRIIR